MDASKIRIANIVSESSGRKKRAVGCQVTVEIGNHPMDNSETQFTYSEASTIADQIAECVGLGTLGDAFDVPISDVRVTYPVPPADSDDWGAYVTMMETTLGQGEVVALQLVLVYLILMIYIQLVCDLSQNINCSIIHNPYILVHVCSIISSIDFRDSS